MHDSIAAQVLALCRERGLTLSAAESITGGLIAKCITDVPGASQVFLGGVVSYTNEVKNHVLGVPSSLLEAYGAVSEPVARAMAMGVRVLARRGRPGQPGGHRVRGAVRAGGRVRPAAGAERRPGAYPRPHRPPRI